MLHCVCAWITKHSTPLTMKNNYLMTKNDNSFDRLGQVTVFSKIDHRSGYWQFRVNPNDMAKTTFNTGYGQYEILVKPVLAAFQTLMNQVLILWLDRFVLVYLGEFLINSKSMYVCTEALIALRRCELYAVPKNFETDLTEL